MVEAPGPWPGPDTQTLATRDPAVIRRWAELRQARPATGLQTASGPSISVSVNDGGAAVRFNFPGVSLFRDIAWDEWLSYFRQQDLLFVFEERTEEGTVSYRYRIVRLDEWRWQFDLEPAARLRTLRATLPGRRAGREPAGA